MSMIYFPEFVLPTLAYFSLGAVSVGILYLLKILWKDYRERKLW